MSARSAGADLPSPAKAECTLTLSVESRLDQIRLVRAAMGGVLSHLDVDEADTHALCLAVSEILNNAMEHGYRGDEQQQVEVRLRICMSDVEVEILDSAPPYPEAERHRLTGEFVTPKDPSEEWTMRGHGLQIVRQLVDSISLVVADGHNCMTLKKRVAIQPH